MPGMGLALGGGIGLSMRQHGLTCDNILAAQIVIANGSLVSNHLRHCLQFCGGVWPAQYQTAAAAAAAAMMKFVTITTTRRGHDYAWLQIEISSSVNPGLLAGLQGAGTVFSVLFLKAPSSCLGGQGMCMLATSSSQTIATSPPFSKLSPIVH